MYKICYDKKIHKWLEKISKQDQKFILTKIEKLAKDPRPSGVKPLNGEYGGLYRIRSGTYRIIYDIQDTQLIILIVKIGKRKEVYR